MFVPVTQLGPDAHVELADYYSHSSWDCGVLWAAIEDSHGRRSCVCIDARLDSPTCNRLFDQARHPTLPEAVFVELGAEAEGIAIPLISWWIDSPATWESGMYHDHFQEIAQSILLKLGT